MKKITIHRVAPDAAEILCACGAALQVSSGDGTPIPDFALEILAEEWTHGHA